ncbi:MAG: hypothetical protein M1825_006476 [Sarcosagium campestre]|nr:MAG: hypothetical protein M1825_006476 [Sarcosagium campestre]
MILVLNSVPTLQRRFVAYGARSRTENNGTRNAKDEQDGQARTKSSPSSGVFAILDWLEDLKVPHHWFSHFYLLSIALSLFWAVQMAMDGFALRGLASLQCPTKRQDPECGGMTLHQTILCWLLMGLQGSRRLLECNYLGRKSTSHMSVAHWLLGLSFYTAMSVAVWIEGIPALRSAEISLDLVAINAPTMKTFVGLPVLLIASGVQHDCHVYLSSLKKYTLPIHPIFQRIVCPHYTAECLIYLSLAFIGSPSGALFNRTLFAAFIFVTVNLGVSAALSKEWYQHRFGRESVEGRWRMVPLLF